MNQPLPLVEQLKNLEHLQELDLKIDALKRNQSALPASLKALDDAVAKVQNTVTLKTNQITEIEKAHRQARAALDLNKDRLTRSNSKLEGVSNTQEFQAASKEIEQLKKLNLTLEEQDKKALVDLEALQKESTQLTQDLSKLKQDRDAQAAVLSGQESQFKNDIAALMSERQKFSSCVETRILAQYDRVRGARNGLGIVPAVGGRCKGCNMMVPPQLYNEVQRGSTLHSCPSCHRLLFVPVATTDAQGGKSADLK